MEPAQAKIRNITAAWKVSDWWIKNGVVYLTLNGITIGFDLTAAQLADWAGPNQPLNIVLEIPCPPLTNTNPTTSPSSS